MGRTSRLLFLYASLMFIVFCSEDCDSELGGYCEDPTVQSIHASPSYFKKFTNFPLLRIAEKIGQKELKLDLLLFLSLLFFIAVYVFGSLKNRKIYKLWKQQVEEQWTNISKNNSIVYKLRNDHYLLCNNPTKKQNAKEQRYETLTMQLTLVGRYNLLKLIVDSYSMNDIQDKVSINYKLNTNLKGIFAMVRKENANDYRRNRYDFNNLTKQAKIQELDAQYHMLYESPEMFKILESEKFKEKMQNCKDYILSISYSDHPTSCPQKLPVEETKILSLEYKITNLKKNNKAIEEIKDLCELLIDIFVNLEISPEGRKKITKNRELVYQPIEKKIQEEKKKLLEEKKNNVNLDVDRKAEREKMKKREEKKKKKMGKKGATKVMMRS